MEIMLFMFGMDIPIKVGEVNEKGKIAINFPNKLPDSLAQENMKMFATELPYALFFSCFDLNKKNDTANNIVVYKGGHFSLAHKTHPYAGTLFAVSDSSLIPWLEDRYYQNPVIASFYEVIYCEGEIDLKTSCRETIQYEQTDITVDYNYSLRLKKGFNLIEYKIETIKETGIKDLPPIPSLVTIKNTTDIFAVKWYAKYFYSQFN